jgi:PAS domain S-box-containing protein
MTKLPGHVSPGNWPLDVLCEAVFEGSRDAVFLSDGDSRFVAVNRAACDLTGYSREELLGMSIPELHDDVDLEAYRTFHARILAGEEILSQAAIRRKDGSKVETEFSNRAVRVGDAPCMHTTARDVSGRVRMEAVLRESETRFRVLVEQAGEGFELVDEGGLFVSVNAESCRQTGYTREELLQLSVFDIVPSLTPERFLANWAARAAGGPMTLETVHRRKDGTLFPVEVKTSMVRLGGKDLTFSLSQDITERRRAEGAVRRAAEQYRILTENVKDVVWVLDVESMSFRYVSPAIEGLLGFPVQEVLAMPLGQPFPPEAGERLRTTVRDRAAAFVEGGERPGAFFTDEVRQPHRDGTAVWTEIVSGYYRNEENGRVELRGVTRDVTDRRNALDEIRRLNETLEDRVADRTTQLEAAIRELESFSYSVSHDLRAPLRAIDGFSAKVLNEHGERLGAEGLRLLTVVRRNAARMGRLIDDLLTFSRTNRAEMSRSKVGMGDLARAAFAEVTGEGPQADRIAFSLGDLPDAWGDPSLLRQVWVNLLSNAVKFSAPSEKPVVEVTGGLEEGEAVYRVRDNGVGFDMAYASKLFGVFQRLHGATEFEGTGVGLALVQRIVVRHGGRIWAEAAVGQGATFGFALPTGPPHRTGRRSGSVPALGA